MATVSCSAVLAQAVRRDEGGGASRLQAAVQQLAAERETLAAENLKLKEKVSALEEELKTLKTEQESLASRATRAEAQLNRSEASQQNLNSTLEATRGRLDEVVAKYRELAETLRTTETKRNRLQSDLTAGRRELESCQTANVELAGIAEQALVRYEKKGCFGALAQAEPFTGLSRTRIENLVEGYRARIAETTIPTAKTDQPR
jgi:chromosome segregation ATPase